MMFMWELIDAKSTKTLSGSQQASPFIFLFPTVCPHNHVGVGTSRHLNFGDLLRTCYRGGRGAWRDSLVGNTFHTSISTSV